MNIKIKESPLFWPAKLKKDVLEVLDETLIPKKLHYIKVKNAAGAVRVIRDMKTRAFGQFLVVLSTFLLELERNKDLSEEKLLAKIQDVANRLNKSRPTFPFAEVTGVVVRWATMAVDAKMKIRPFVKRMDWKNDTLTITVMAVENKMARVIEIIEALLPQEFFEPYKLTYIRTGQFVIENEIRKDPMEIVS